MTVGSHHCNIFGRNIEIDTVHHRAKFVVGSSKHCTVDASQQNGSLHFYTDCVLAQHGRLRKLVCILSHEAVFTILILHGDFQRVHVHIKCQRLFGDLLQGIQQSLGCDGKTSVRIAFVHLNRCDHRGFTIGCCYRQSPILQFKKEAIQNGQCIFRINHATDSLQMTGECST